MVPALERNGVVRSPDLIARVQVEFYPARELINGSHRLWKNS
jgi:hypothetical protein